MAAQADIDALRANLADTGNPPAFSDVELGALIDAAAAAGADDIAERAELAALWEMRANAARLTTYSTGLTQERRDQVFAQLRLQWTDLKATLDERQAARDAAARGGLAAPAQTAAVPVAWVW